MESIKKWIEEGEHQQQDFKFRIDDSKKIARTLSAFANTDGGRLLIGVKDNGKITGIDPSEEIHLIEAAAEMYCSPKIIWEHRVWQEDLKLVLEIYVPKSIEKPILAIDEDGKWRAFLRSKDETLLANKIIVFYWKQKEKKHQKPERIGEEETQLLQLIDSNNPITLSKLYKLSELKNKRIDQLLVLFLTWDLIQYTVNENGTYFLSK